MSVSIVNKILEHPDKEEIINKLIMNVPEKDIYDWLFFTYSSLKEKKFIISEKSLTKFKNEYLDIYKSIKDDILNVKNKDGDLSLTLQNNSAYKELVLKTANQELDVRAMVKNLANAIETRFAQVFDELQKNPEAMNPKIDRILIEYTQVFAEILKKYYDFTEAPQNQIVNNNVTLQVVDQHITIFHDVIKEILADMDIATSLHFMEVFNDKMAKMKTPDIAKEILDQDTKIAEVKLLSETVNKRLHE